MIIDTHVHIVPPRMINHREEIVREDRAFRELFNNPKAKMAGVETVIEEMDRCRISKCVVSGTGYSLHKFCMESNEYILDSVSRFPDRLIGLVTVQPNAGDEAIYELERCISAGAKGVGEVRNDLQGFNLADNEIVRDIAAILIRNHLVWLTHTSEPVGHNYPGKGRINPEAIYPFVLQNPQLKIIMAHWGGGLPFYALMPEVKLALANVYFDTAATTFLYERNIFRHVVSLVGASHVVFGSDFPLLKPDKVKRQMELSDLNQDEMEKIMYLNAKEIFINGCQ